jgi:hypothetical protein
LNRHRLLCAAAGLLVVLGAGAAVARAAGSPSRHDAAGNVSKESCATLTIK